MPVIANANDGFMRTMDALKLLFGLAPDPEPPLMWLSQFGFHGYTISVFRSHIDYLNPDNPLAPSFPRSRESSEINTPRSGQNLDVDPLRGILLINWIPACAGMTNSRSNGQSGLMQSTP